MAKAVVEHSDVSVCYEEADRITELENMLFALARWRILHVFAEWRSISHHESI